MLKLSRFIFLLCLLLSSGQWALASVGSPGDLHKVHAKEDENCDKCHKKFNKAAQPGLCGACHKEVSRDISEKRGYHGRLQEQKECKECHPDHKGRAAKIITLETAKFDHAKTDFQLKGGHLNEKVKCKSCHIETKKYSEAPSVCYSCHKKGSFEKRVD
jgi:DnaJ-class molecular chaperone